MPKKKTITVDNQTPLPTPEPVKEDLKVVSIALDKNFNMYGVTEDNKVAKYDFVAKKWAYL